jgi:hypothetical protein
VRAESDLDWDDLSHGAQCKWEIEELARFFREEEPEWGARGDHENWTPTLAAIELIRSLRRSGLMDKPIGYVVWDEKYDLAYQSRIYEKMAKAEDVLAKIVWHSRERYRVRPVVLAGEGLTGGLTWVRRSHRGS